MLLLPHLLLSHDLCFSPLSLLVCRLGLHHITSPSFGFLDLLPRLHLFLLQKSDSIGKQLGIFLNTKGLVIIGHLLLPLFLGNELRLHGSACRADAILPFD